MIQNPITFVLDASGNYLGSQRGTIRALSNYASKIYVVAPYESVALRVHYLVYGTQREVIGQYLAPTSLYGRDVLSANDANFATASDFSVWEVSISQRALHRIAKYRAGRIGVSFQALSIAQPSQALNAVGTLTTNNSLPDPATYAGSDGDYYVSDVWNYTDQYIAGTFAKGTYFYFDTDAWVEGQNITYTVQTTTVDLSVDPSLLAELPDDISEDAELQTLIDELIGDVATLQTTVDSHITDYTDPHDLQANQVESSYRSSASDVQSDIDSITGEIDAITDGSTDITYDPTADDIIDATTVDGALGQLDSALYTHITDLTNPHEVDATQVNTTFNSSTVSVKNALDTLQATKVAKDPDTITSVSGSNKVYVNDGSEKLITVANLKTSIVEDLVAFGYVIFTEKDVDGQPVVASPQTNKIYLYNPDDSDIDNDQYEEWVYIDSAFELIGITGIALEDYYTKTETDDLLEIPLRLQLYPNTKNTSGSTIVKGAVVQFAGSQGDFIQIKEAVASEINADPSLLMGLAKDDILDNAFGDVVWFGNVLEIATGSFSLGDILWFDTVNGGLTNVEPSDDKIQIAAVEKASSTPTSTNGILLVRIKYVTRQIGDVSGLQTALDGKVNLPETEVNNGVGYWDSANNRFNTSNSFYVEPLNNRFRVTGDIRTPYIANISTNSNSQISLNTTGTTISRNIADANPALVVNQANASSTGDILKVQAAGTDRLTVKRDGNVGIGTTSPDSVLTVNGGTSNTPARFISTDANTNIALIDNSGAALVNGLGGALTFLTGYDANISGGSEKMRIETGGNVGIGTTSPSAKLHVLSTTLGSDLAFFRNDADAVNITIKTLSSLGIIKSGAGDDLQLSSNGSDTQGIRITQAGNVGIGNTTPTEKLDVTGNIKASGSVTSDTATVTNNATVGTLTLGSFTLEYNEATQSLNFNFSE